MKSVTVFGDDGETIQDGFRTINGLKEVDILQDAVIETEDGERIGVSRFMMAAGGSFFRTLFTGSLPPPVGQDIFIPGVSSQVMKIIVNFIYSRRLEGVTQKNFEELFRAVDRFGVMNVVKELKQFLLKDLSRDNCLYYHRLADLYYAPEVKVSSEKLILENFKELSAEVKNSMTYEEFLFFISNDHLNVNREEQTYQTIMDWILSDVTNRKGHFPTLLTKVRFGNAAIDFINQILQHEWLQEMPECVEYLIRADEVLRDIQKEPVPAKFDIHKYPYLRPRIPRDIIFTFGGWSAATAVNTLETYDCRVNKWYSFGNQETRVRAYHGMVCFKNEVFVIGGFDGRNHFSTVEAFDPVTKTWKEKGCMNYQRCYVSVAVLGNHIYACGGYDGTTRNNSCERFDDLKNQWSLVAPMIHQRSDASAAALNGKLFVVGGFDGHEVLQSSEFYCPEINQWTLIEPMQNPRSGVQAISFKGLLYVFGGNDGIIRQTSIERYDPVSRAWKIMGHMETPRSNFSVVCLEGLIYVIGGFNGSTTIDKVETFDPEKEQWTASTVWKLNTHRSALSSCVVTGLQNGQEYTWLRKELRQSVSVSNARKRGANPDDGL